MSDVPADLHCHTKFSDGSLCTEDVLTLAARSAINTIAITDHDTLVGASSAQAMGKRAGIKVIPGIELSAFDYKRNRKVHLLAYLYDHTQPIDALCGEMAEKRKKAAEKMIKKVTDLYPINRELIEKAAQGGGDIYKQHIMHALIHAGFARSIFDETYTKLFANKGGLCKAEIEYPDAFHVLGAIKSAGGIAVLAHPSHYKSMSLLPALIDAGMDGVEVWHPRNTRSDIEQLIKIARDKQLVMTGGTDFHGMYTSSPRPIGSFTTPDEQIKALYSKK